MYLVVGCLFSQQVTAEAIPVRSFLLNLATTHHFEVRGSEIIGSETMIALSVGDPEKAVVIALRQYNHVISYNNNKLHVVTILGRKGSDVGALPEEYTEPVAQDASQ